MDRIKMDGDKKFVLTIMFILIGATIIGAMFLRTKLSVISFG